MVKLLEAIGRRRDLTHEQFLEHLSFTHLEVVDRVPEFRNRVRGYVQNHLYVAEREIASIGGLSVAADADAIIEVWWDSAMEIRKAFEEPRYMEVIRPDELSFGDVAGAWGVLARDTVLMEREQFAGITKIFIFMKRNHGIDHATFVKFWQERRDSRLVTSPAFRTLVGRFVENLVDDSTEALPGMRPFDLVAELWFDSLRHATQFTGDADVVAAIGGSGADFADPTQTLIYIARQDPVSFGWLGRRDVLG